MEFCILDDALRYVSDFQKPAQRWREPVGRNGVGLAEITQLGIPPYGSTVTIEACRSPSPRR